MCLPARNIISRTIDTACGNVDVESTSHISIISYSYFLQFQPPFFNPIALGGDDCANYNSAFKVIFLKLRIDLMKIGFSLFTAI